MAKSKLTDIKVMEYGMYLFVIVLFVGYSTSYKFVGLYIPAIFFFLRMWLTNSIYRFWKSSLFVPLLLFILSGLLSTIFAQNKLESLIFFEKFHLRTFFIYVVVISVFNNRVKFKRLLHIVALTSIIYIFWSYSIYLNEIISLNYIRRVEISNTAWPLLYLIPFILLAIFSSTKWISKRFWWAVLFLSIIALIFSGQRSAVLGLVGLFGIWWIYMKKKLKIKLVLLSLSCTIIVFMFVGDFPVIKDYTFRGFESPGRRILYATYMKVFKDNYLLGIGLDNKAMYEAQKDQFYSMQGRLLQKPQTPHSMFLSIAVKQGLIGLIAYIFLLIVSIISIIKRISKKPPSLYKTTGISLLSCFIGMYTICALVVDLVFMPFALLLGMAGAYLNIKEEQINMKIIERKGLDYENMSQSKV